jgi:hypothetical protein
MTEPTDASAAPPAGLWEKMKADPQYAPEHLALEAVRRLGPQARDWVADTRRRNPMAPTDEIAKMAVAKFTNLARLSGATSGVAGLAGAVVDIGVLAWTQARMVLHIAAAYGIDPTDPNRATDLLVLQKVHKYAEGARLALAVAQGRERTGALLAMGRTPLGRAIGQLGVKLAKMAGVRAAKRLAAKIVPGAAVVLGAWANSSATTDLANRAVAMYRGAGPAALAPGPDFAAPPPHGQTERAGPAQ